MAIKIGDSDQEKYKESHNNNNNNNDHDNNVQLHDSAGIPSVDDPASIGDSPHPYSFNGRVIIGIGLALAVAAAGTIIATFFSQSPQISTSSSSIAAGLFAKQLSTRYSTNSGNQMHSALAQPQSQPIESQPSSSSSLTQSAKYGTIVNSKPPRSLVLVANDFGWNGTENGPTIKVATGDNIQITVINNGKMAHNFGITKISDKTREILNEMQSMPLSYRVKHISYQDMASMPCPGCQPVFEKAHINYFIQPGAQQVVTFTADQSGIYKYFCMVRGHIWLGMAGDFIVENPTQQTKPSPEKVLGRSENQ